MSALHEPRSAEFASTTDEYIDQAVTVADPMVLRGALYLLTGDEDLRTLRTDTVMSGYVECQNVVDDVALASLHGKAAAYLRGLRDGTQESPAVEPARVVESLRLAAGAEIALADEEVWIEQAAFDPWCRSVAIEDAHARAQREGFKVVVIGAGMGGLNAAIQLQRSGIPYVLVEKNHEVGGTWHTNRYPGARVDSASRIYSHVYAVDYEFPNAFCAQPENEKYFNWMADEFDLREHIDFGTEVTSMNWDEDSATWTVVTKAEGGERVYRANAVISSVGPFTRYSMPTIPGRETFTGRSFHTAEWPPDLDVTGKRVAVVGTGCTGYQLAPVVAKQAAHTYLFQRTPNWCFELDGYTTPLPEPHLWLERHLPYFSNFIRFRMSFLLGPTVARRVFELDPDYNDPHALSAFNKMVREQRLAFLESKLGDHPDLLEAMTPVAPPFTARPVLVDAHDSVFDAMVKDDFDLVTSGIAEVNATGIETTDGRQIDLDVIAFATGYRPNDFLWPMEITGRDGRSLEDIWNKDGARAYVGTMMPGFPNLFLVYGPNTNPTAGLTVIDFEEMVARFAIDCVRGLLERDLSSVDVSEEAFHRYNDELDRWESMKTYTDSRAVNYYKNQYGRTSFNCPIDGRLMWSWLRSPVEPKPGVLEHGGLRPHFGEDLVVR